MDEFGTFLGGLSGKSKSDFEGGNARYVTYMNIFRNLEVDLGDLASVRIGPEEKQNKVVVGDILFTGSSESIDEVGMTSVLTDTPVEPTYMNSFSICFRPTDSEMLDPNFSKHLFRSSLIRSEITRAASGVTRFNLSKTRLGKTMIPVPTLAEQKKISHTLDAFHALTSGVQAGLPAEITARRKQYEYYRDKLLTFEELVA